MIIKYIMQYIYSKLTTPSRLVNMELHSVLYEIEKFGKILQIYLSQFMLVR